MSERASFSDQVRAQTIRRLAEKTNTVVASELPPNLGDAVASVLAQPAINDVPLFERLCRRVGLGQDPVKRKKFFSRLVALHRNHREAVEAIISESWACAQSARWKDRYFCKAVCAKLAEAKLCAPGSMGGAADVI